MRVCSFLPAATSMMVDMHLENLLVGVTFECEADRPRVVRSYLEGEAIDSATIDRIVSKSYAAGKSLYYVDEDLLQQLKPDVIFTQDVCDVCQISDREVQTIIARLPVQPKLVPLHPHTLKEVFQNAVTIASVCGHEDAANSYLSVLQERIDVMTLGLKRNEMASKEVSVLEWLDPMYNCGHWIPDQIGLAGGIDRFSHPGGHSVVIPWETILHYDPEVLVIAPCGFKVERAIKELSVLTKKSGLAEMRAYRDGNIYFADAGFFTQPAAGKLIAGIELLAHLFHPQLFPLDVSLQNAFITVREITR